MWPLLLTLIALGAPGSTTERAETYYREGVAAFTAERFAIALEKLEMAAMLGRFEFGAEPQVASALHLAVQSSLKIGDANRAVRRAREAVRWAERRSAAERFTAWLDLAEAYQLLGTWDDAELALENALGVGASLALPLEQERYARLKSRERQRGTADASPAESGADGDAPPADAPMRLIPEGVFAMGELDGDRDTRPKRMILLPAYYIDEHEVTNEAFARFVAETGYTARGNWTAYAPPGAERDPVRGVTWHDAQAYAAWAGKRLPSEAEWERAARGPEGHRYASGDHFDPGRARVGLELDSGPVAVKSYAANGFGVHDLTGNVLEWLADWYAPDAYASAYASSPLGPAAGTRRVLRGGSWHADAASARVAKRHALPPEVARPDVGFRCARSVAPAPTPPRKR